MQNCRSRIVSYGYLLLWEVYWTWLCLLVGGVASWSCTRWAILTVKNEQITDCFTSQELAWLHAQSLQTGSLSNTNTHTHTCCLFGDAVGATHCRLHLRANQMTSDAVIPAWLEAPPCRSLVVCCENCCVSQSSSLVHCLLMLRK